MATPYKMSFETDDDVFRQEKRGELGELFTAFLCSDLGTSHCPNGATELSRHPGFYEAAHLAEAIVAGLDSKTLKRKRPKRRMSKAEEIRRGEALDIFERTAGRVMTPPDADDRELLENVLLRVRIAADAGIIGPAAARDMEADVRHRLRRHSRKVN